MAKLPVKPKKPGTPLEVKDLTGSKVGRDGFVGSHRIAKSALDNSGFDLQGRLTLSDGTKAWDRELAENNGQSLPGYRAKPSDAAGYAQHSGNHSFLTSVVQQRLVVWTRDLDTALAAAPPQQHDAIKREFAQRAQRLSDGIAVLSTDSFASNNGRLIYTTTDPRAASVIANWASMNDSAKSLAISTYNDNLINGVIDASGNYKPGWDLKMKVVADLTGGEVWMVRPGMGHIADEVIAIAGDSIGTRNAIDVINENPERFTNFDPKLVGEIQAARKAGVPLSKVVGSVLAGGGDLLVKVSPIGDAADAATVGTIVYRVARGDAVLDWSQQYDGESLEAPILSSISSLIQGDSYSFPIVPSTYTNGTTTDQRIKNYFAENYNVPNHLVPYESSPGKYLFHDLVTGQRDVRLGFWVPNVGQPPPPSDQAPSGKKLPVVLRPVEGDGITVHDLNTGRAVSTKDPEVARAIERLALGGNDPGDMALVDANRGKIALVDGGSQPLTSDEIAQRAVEEQLAIAAVNATGGLRPKEASRSFVTLAKHFGASVWRFLTQPSSDQSAGGLGLAFGTALGRALAQDDAPLGVISGSLLGAVALNLGQMLDPARHAYTHSDGTEGSHYEVGESVWGDFKAEFKQIVGGAAIGAVSSYFAAELGEALGLEGFTGEFVQAGVGGVVGQALTNLTGIGNAHVHGLLEGATWKESLGHLKNGFSASQLGQLGANVVANFFASKLASAIVTAETQAGAILGSLGSAIGSFFFGVVGSFIGQVIGTFIGNLFGRKKPRVPEANAETVLQIPFARYDVANPTQANGGNLNLVLSMAEAARDTLNGLIEQVTRGDENARVANPTVNSTTQVYGHKGSKLWLKLGATTYWGASTTNENAGSAELFNSADELVDKGVLFALPATQIIGGDLFLKRAIHNQVRHPGQAPNVAAFMGDLQIAEQYLFYLQNRAVIDAMIAEPYTSMAVDRPDFEGYIVAQADLNNYYTDPNNLQGQAGGFSKHAYGQWHWENHGSGEGRIMPSVTGPDYDAYVRAFSDLDAWYAHPANNLGRAGGYTRYEYGWWHYFNAGQSEGRALPSGVAIDQAFYDANKAFMTRALAKESVPLDNSSASRQVRPNGQLRNDAEWYADNRRQVDRIIGDLDLTTLAAGWIITLQRAAELELNRAAPSDFYGGAKGFVDSLALTIAGAPLDYETIQFSLQGADLHVRYAPVGATGTNNLVVGGPDGLGAIRNWSTGPDGQPFAIDQAHVDGEAAVVVKTSASSLDSATWRFAGSLNLEVGDLPDGRMAVRPGEIVSGVVEAKSQSGGGHLGGVVHFEDANGAYLTHSSWTAMDTSATSWSRFVVSGVAPANAARAWVELFVYQQASNPSSEIAVALRRPQVHRLSSGQSVPDWAGAPYEKFVEKNFFADVGYHQTTGQALGATSQGAAAASALVVPHNWSQEVHITEQVFVSATGVDVAEGNDYWVHSGPAPITMDDRREETYLVSYDIYENNYDNTVYIGSYTGHYTAVQSGGDDIFVGGEGNDTLRGRAGFDWLDGGAGDDTIEGGDEDEDDVLPGDDDVLLGKAGDDLLKGGAGDDWIDGGDGFDTIRGGTGNDRLSGGATTDHVYGDDGDDTLYAGRGGGNFHGGNGSDTISYADLQSGYIGTNWPDTMVTSTPGVFASLYNAVGNRGASTNDTLVSIENVEGSSFDDGLEGNASANVLKGREGRDWLFGLGGADTLEGGVDADTLYGGDGNDTASYKSSATWVWVDLTTGEILNGDAEGDVLIEIERLEGSNFADTLKGNSGANRLIGLKGDDWFLATAGGDLHDGGEGFDTVDYSEFASAVSLTISADPAATTHGSKAASEHSYKGIEHAVGSALNDTLIGSAMDETFTGGKGNDTLKGEDGSDTYILNLGDGADTITENETGANKIVLAEGTWDNFWFETPGDTLTVRFGTASATIKRNFRGDSRNNVIKSIDMGGVGAIEIGQLENARGGGAGNDTVVGQVGERHDLLAGYDGADTIRGTNSWEQRGNVIIGGRGNDLVFTSDGDDQFVFERGHGRDVVDDTGGEDVLVFGPTVEAKDVIFKVIKTQAEVSEAASTGATVAIGDLVIAARDLAAPTNPAHMSVDFVRVIGGGTLRHYYYDNVYQGTPDPLTIEFVIAGGASIDLRKLKLDWHEEDIHDYSGGGDGQVLPVVFDLGGDGVDLVSIGHSPIVLKGDEANQPLMRIGWVDGQDGLLAIDRDGDGDISRLQEISFVQEKEGAKTDLEGLVGLDSNADGKLDANDARWSELKLWRDVNQNGIGKGKEVVDLMTAGIVAIELSLRPTGFDGTNTRDNAVLNTATFHWADGRAGTVHDVALAKRYAHIDGWKTGKRRSEWGATPTDGELGRVRGKDGKSSAKLLNVASNALSPVQDLLWVREDKDDGKNALPKVINKKTTLTDLAGNLLDLNGAVAPSAGTAAPLAIDLDGDGVDLIDAKASPLYVDLDEDGWADRIGWVGANDAILALDRDGDTLVSAIHEISFIEDAPGAQTDLQGLSAFDTDGDGALTSSDSQWDSFLVWRDADQDGRSVYEELQTLSEAGISWIDLRPGALSRNPPAASTENTVLGRTTVTFEDGRVRGALDVALGSISGLQLAIDETTADPEVVAALNERIGGGGEGPIQPWALNPALRRLLLGDITDDDESAATFDSSEEPAPAPVLTEATRTLAEPAQPEQLTRHDRVRSNAPEHSASPSEAAELDPVEMARSSRSRARWWSERTPSEEMQPVSLDVLMARLAGGVDSKSDEAPRGADRETPAAAELARRRDGFVDALVSFGSRRSGGEARRRIDAALADVGDAAGAAQNWTKRRPSVFS